jgi:hypothetical protein
MMGVTTMTSKERVKAATAFQPVDRAPFNFWMDRRMMARYEDRWGRDFRARHYDADVIETFLFTPFPAGSAEERSGSYWVMEPLISDLSLAADLEMPDPEALDVCQYVRSDLERFPDKFVLLDVPGVFTIAEGIRCPENLMTDIFDKPDELRALLDRISDVLEAAVRKACELPIDAVYTMDDIGSSKGLILSPEMIQQWVFDFNRKYVRAALDAGKPVWMHTDGCVIDAMDMIVDMGVTVINPLEPKLNDLPTFKRDYHETRKLAVYGALDTYGVIPYGSVEDVRKHVRDTYEMFGRNGGLVFSTHDIPIDTPEENVEAMVEEIKACR